LIFKPECMVASVQHLQRRSMIHFQNINQDLE
jgi:hypothetical protein